MSEMLENAGTAVSQSEVATFNFGNLPVRTKIINNEPWFVAKDVCDVLGLSNITEALRNLEDDELTSEILKSGNQGREMKLVSESGLYALVIRSNKPNARKFRKWVTSEVLPAIRKHGGYVTTNGTETPEELYARAMTSLHAALERQRAISSEQAAQLAEQAPAVEYCNNVLSASNLHTVNSIAVHLGISAIRLNRFLVEHGLIYKQGDIYCPSCKIRDKGYCDFHVVPYLSSSGEKMTREHLKWTEAGRKFVIELWNRQHNLEKGA